MAANTSPIFSLLGEVSSDSATAMAPTLTTAAADYTGISVNNKLVWTADPTNGGYIAKLRFKPIGTNVATVARIYLNNGSVNTTATNNSFIGETSLPVTTAAATVALPEIEYLLGFAINPGFRVWVGLGTTVAAGWVVTGIGGQY